VEEKKLGNFMHFKDTKKKSEWVFGFLRGGGRGAGGGVGGGMNHHCQKSGVLRTTKVNQHPPEHTIHPLDAYYYPHQLWMNLT